MIIDPSKPLKPQAELAVANRDANHHINIDENDEPWQRGFLSATVDRYAVGDAVDYSNRLSDFAYSAIRGREQQLIDYHGGARSDVSPWRTENRIRGVARDNILGLFFHHSSNYLFGTLHPYTGD